MLLPWGQLLASGDAGRVLVMRLCNVGSCHDCIFAAAGSGGSGGSALDASLCSPMSSLEASLIHPPSLAIVRMHPHSKVQVYRHARRFNPVR